MNRMMRVLESDESYAFHEYRVFHKNGSQRWVECSLSQVEYNDKKAIQIAQIDNTSRKLAEKKVENERDLAELFLDLMGHDLSNIHQTVHGLLDLLLLKEDLPETTTDILH